MSVDVSYSDQNIKNDNANRNLIIEDKPLFNVTNYEAKTAINTTDSIHSNDVRAEVDLNEDKKRNSIKEAEVSIADLDPKEIERKQLEANEETTRSGDLKVFMQEMEQKYPPSVQRMLSINSQNNSIISPNKDMIDTYPDCDIPIMVADPVGPPDGGWAWLVVFASFICMMTIDGTCFNYGLLVPGMMESFSQTAIAPYIWPGSLLAGLCMLIGPIASALSNQFGFRPVAIAGALVSGTAIFLSSFLKNVSVFILFFGVFGGIGFGLIYLPAIAIVGHWFHEKRPIAVGVALCGSGCGTFIFGQVMPVLIDMITWKGTVILISAVCVQALVLVSLFRPLELHLRLKQLSKIQSNVRKLHRTERRRQRLEYKHKCEEDKKQRKGEKDQLNDENRMKNKKIVIYRGTIMQKIIEEKKRQRTVSMGSLDGMVMTRDNELIQVNNSSVDLYEKPLLSTEVINRITESVVKKLQNKIKKHGPNRVVASNNSYNSKSGGLGGLGTNVNITNNQMKNSLSQLVQEYINSQLSMQMTKSQSYSLNIKNNQVASLQRQPSVQSSSYQSNWSSRTSLVQGLVLQDDVKAGIQARIKREIVNPFSKKELFYTGSIQQLENNSSENADKPKRSLTSLNIMNNIIVDEIGNQGYLDAGDISQMGIEDNNYNNVCSDERDIQMNDSTFRRLMQELLDVNLLKSPTFILMVISSSISMFGVFVPFFILPSYLMSMDKSLSMAGQLISYVGIANILGRIFATVYIEKAWSSDYPCADCLWINNFALILAGAAACSIPYLINHYAALIFVLCLYGLCVAVFVSLKSILVVELLGLDKLTNAFGFLLIFQGFATIFGSPVAAWFFDLTNGSYEAAFYFSGAVIMFSAILCFPLRLLSTFERKCIKTRCGNALFDDEKLTVLRDFDVQNEENKEEPVEAVNHENQNLKVTEAPDAIALEPVVEVEEDLNSDSSQNKLEWLKKYKG